MNVRVHETAVVDEGAQLGSGTAVWHFCHISSGARIGSNCTFGQNVFVANVAIGSNVKVQNNVSIYEGILIEDDVFLGPSSVLTNVSNPRSQVNRRALYETTVLRRGCTVGANATIVCGVSLGAYSFVGAGAVVTRDVAPYQLVLGTPAKPAGWMSRHGHRLRFSGRDAVATCAESGLRYQLRHGGVMCLDVDEKEALPDALTQGKARYHDLKTHNEREHQTT